MAQSQTSGLSFVVIASVVCISISLIQTAIGYSPLFGSPITWIVSGIISIFMFRTNLELRSAIQTRSAIGGLVLFYLILTMVSFIGNFNAFYSRFMKTELYAQEIREYQESIPGLASSAKIKLGETNNYNELEGKVRGLIVPLKQQIQDPLNSGFGDKAKIIGTEIEELLDVKLTEVNGTPKQKADAMEEQIEAVLEQKKITLTSDVTPVIVKIEQKVKQIEPKLENALIPKNIESQGRNAIEQAARVYNSIGETTQKIVTDFKFERKEARNLEVGKLSHSLNSAFVERVNSSATLISTLASLLIDFLVPIYIFLTVKKISTDSVSTSSNNQNNTSNRGNSMITKNDWLSRLIRGGNSGANSIDD